jgi:hypothetical protein
MEDLNALVNWEEELYLDLRHRPCIHRDLQKLEATGIQASQ